MIPWHRREPSEEALPYASRRPLDLQQGSHCSEHSGFGPLRSCGSLSLSRWPPSQGSTGQDLICEALSGNRGENSLEARPSDD